ncbi:hypothetical protein JZ751_022506 [Albula glossodonta]|uniref:Ig-like domain-containing protein n=1 Tax=Albula glossodonta TaxID=121402 RepID=A0A8T2NQJ3_9TELE|nr:hypothetical protein JZ751_022506 [Albula glossodonta]
MEVDDGDLPHKHSGERDINSKPPRCKFVSMPVVYVSCTVDGRVKLTCSVGRGDEVTVHWIVFSDLSNHTINGTSAKHHTLYLGWQTPGYLVCVAGNRVSQKSSLRVTKTCRAHISSLMALGLFIACPTLAMAILKLKEKQPNEPRKDAEENVYIAMHGKKEIRAPPELDTSYYVSCGPPPTRLQEDGGSPLILAFEVEDPFEDVTQEWPYNARLGSCHGNHGNHGNGATRQEEVTCDLQ